MKIKMKAALLSGLVFPGLGQIIKGSRIKGFIIIIAVNFLFLAAFALILRETYLLVLSGNISTTTDPLATAKRILEETPGLGWLTGILLCVWVYGIADALIAGSGKQQ